MSWPHNSDFFPSISPWFAVDVLIIYISRPKALGKKRRQWNMQVLSVKVSARMMKLQCNGETEACSAWPLCWPGGSRDWIIGWVVGGLSVDPNERRKWKDEKANEAYSLRMDSVIPDIDFPICQVVSRGMAYNREVASVIIFGSCYNMRLNQDMEESYKVKSHYISLFIHGENVLVSDFQNEMQPTVLTALFHPFLNQSFQLLTYTKPIHILHVFWSG